LGVVPSEAHIGLSVGEAQIGSTFLLGLGIGHGCEGQPTIAVRLQIPAGVISVQPIPKPGWDIDMVTGGYAAPQMQGDTPVAEGVTEVHWTGGNLPSAFYDQFFIRVRIANDVEPGTMIWFPVIQECTEDVHRWITVPVEGQPEPEEPTPGLRVIEATEMGGGGH
jgi:uncharacterized protein YcnI